MKQNKFGEIIYSEVDVFNLVMQGQNVHELDEFFIDTNIDFSLARDLLKQVPQAIVYDPAIEQLEVSDFDRLNQQSWHMPSEYKNLDIAKHLLELCSTQEELQRVGEELLLYQKRDMFDLLRYLKYLVDTMKQNDVIWGVGRGSSVASYVLYLLGVHRINSMYYDLDIHDFLR